MACGCMNKRAKSATEYQLTLPKGKAFDDGKTTHQYKTVGEAHAARVAHGGGAIKPVKVTK